MKKPNVIQVAAGTTLVISMGANAWYGIAEWDRGGAALILAGVWMPVAIVLLERVMHSMKLEGGKAFFFGLGIILVAAACMYYSMSHLAHVATPEAATTKEKVDGWIFAASVDVVMILSGLALMFGKKKAEPEVKEKIVEVQVPVEVEKIVYVEVPSSPAPAVVEAHAEIEETETVTETRSITRTRRAAMTAEQRGQVLKLITLKRDEIAAGKRGVAVEIMKMVGLEGHPNKITTLPEWKEIKA